MSTTINEKFEYISVLMDDDNLTEEMLDRLLADEEAVQKWHEYHLISDYMKHQTTAAGTNTNFLQDASFQAQLAEISLEHQAASKEAVPPKAKVAANNHSFKIFALAASVAAVAVSVWQFWPQMNQQAVPVATEKVQPANKINGIVNVNGSVNNSAASEPRLEPTVIPDAAQEQTPEKHKAVRTENQQAPLSQTIIQ